MEKLKWLGQFGKDPDGGITRLLYSKEWKEAQHGLKKEFEKSGLIAQFDDVGNLFGRLEGSDFNEETILTGSHVDSVRNGGLFDGAYGIIASFLAINYLKETYGASLRNIEVVSMAEEEGSRFPYSYWGSKNIVGHPSIKDVKSINDFNGVSFNTAIREAGFKYSQNPNQVREDLKAFVEIHIEQGNILEKEDKTIGIVQHIVGQRCYTISLEGESNHAGTTPMGYRKDAMTAAAKMITTVNDMCVQEGDPLVATVGQLELKPNTVNVIPGHARFTIDIRHTHEEVLDQFADTVEKKLTQIAQEHNVNIDIDLWLDESPVPMDKTIVKTIQDQCAKNNLDYRLMHSGAGHDSQIIAPTIPSALIFVPSKNGISHSPKEYTSPEALAIGIDAMIGALYNLAYKK